MLRLCDTWLPAGTGPAWLKPLTTTDMVVAPAYDTAEITTLAAATVVSDYLALVGRRTA